MEISRRTPAAESLRWVKTLDLLPQCCILYDIAHSTPREHCLLYHHRGAFNRVHRGSPTLTLCCKQICPEVNRVYTALGPLWCRCFSICQCRLTRPPSPLSLFRVSVLQLLWGGHSFIKLHPANHPTLESLHFDVLQLSCSASFVSI